MWRLMETAGLGNARYEPLTAGIVSIYSGEKYPVIGDGLIIPQPLSFPCWLQLLVKPDDPESRVRQPTRPKRSRRGTNPSQCRAMHRAWKKVHVHARVIKPKSNSDAATPPRRRI